jgi:hypothetical protein
LAEFDRGRGLSNDAEMTGESERLPGCRVDAASQDGSQPRICERVLGEASGPERRVRENVHQIVDALPEERLTEVLGYLADLQSGTEVPRGLKPTLHEQTIRRARRGYLNTS